MKMPRPVIRTWCAAIALILVLGAAAASAKTPIASVMQWSTSADGIRKLQRMPDLHLVQSDSKNGGNPNTVTVDPTIRYQRMVGFGAAMTDSSAQLLMALPAGPRNALFDELFLPRNLGLSFMRLPIGASDFSTEHYSFDDVAPGQTDPSLTHFSLTKAANQITATLAARARNRQLALMASPWSAPAWMKTSGSLITGRLDPKQSEAFARYLVRYAREMARAGLPISWLTVQNEPDFEPTNYPGMQMNPAERAALVGQYLGPMLARHRSAPRVLDWDHNWDKPEKPLAVLADTVANRYIAGVAWHCYGGNVSAQGTVQALYPSKDSFETECSGGGWAPDWSGSLGWMTSQLIIGASRNGSRGTLLWNLALDEYSGPHKGGCGNCRGVLTISSANGEVTRNVEYYVLGHASRFVRPGARRIASDQQVGIDNVAWRNPDGSIVLLAHNSTKQANTLNVASGKWRFSTELSPGEVSTFVWQK
jgi:glucosylceramidase